MKAKGFVSGFLVIFLLFCSVSAATPQKGTDEEYLNKNYIGLRLGYGFSIVGKNDNSSSYDQYGNKRILFGVASSFNLMSSHKNAPVLNLPIDLDVSFRSNDKQGVKRRHSEFLLDLAPQLGMNMGEITPFINAGFSFSMAYLKYESSYYYYDDYYGYYYYEDKEEYLSFLYGMNMGVGGRIDLQYIFGQLKFQYRYLLGSDHPQTGEMKEYLKNISENRQTLGLVGSAGLKISNQLYLEAGMKFEKSKDRFKYNYKSGWDWYYLYESKWSKWSKWSTGELRIFLGAGIMI